MKYEKSGIFSGLDTSYLFHSTEWTWRAGMPVARRRCPTLGERAARSAQTSCSSTAAPMTRAAPHWRRRPTQASATPTPTSTTTTPSASWTAASASCRKRRAATAPETTSLFPLDPPVFNPVTLKQSQLNDLSRVVSSSLLHKHGHFGFRNCKCIEFICIFFVWFVKFLVWVRKWSRSTLFFIAL